MGAWLFPFLWLFCVLTKSVYRPTVWPVFSAVIPGNTAGNMLAINPPLKPSKATARECLIVLYNHHRQDRPASVDMLEQPGRARFICH